MEQHVLTEVQKQIVEEIQKDPELKSREIVNMFQVSRSYADMIIRWVRKRKMTGAPSGKHRYSQEPHRPSVSQESKAAIVYSRRKCLRCDKPFMSEWKGHRLCESCRNFNIGRAANGFVGLF